MIPLFSEALLSNLFTRPTCGKMWKTNLVSLHASEILPELFCQPPISLIQTQVTARHKQVTMLPPARSAVWRDSRGKAFFFFF